MGMNSGDPVQGSMGMNSAAEGMDSGGQNPVRRSGRIAAKRVQTGIDAAPPGKRRGGRTSLKDDAKTWSELQQSRCRCISAGGAMLSQGGNTCYLEASLQCLIHSSLGDILRKKFGCRCSLETCPSCLLRKTAVSATSGGIVESLTLWKRMISVLFAASGRQEDAGEFLSLLLSRWADRVSHF